MHSRLYISCQPCRLWRLELEHWQAITGAAVLAVSAVVDFAVFGAAWHYRQEVVRYCLGRFQRIVALLRRILAKVWKPDE